MSGIWKGTLLGVLNVLVIAFGLAALGATGPHYFEHGVAYLVFMYGSLPGLCGGAVLGGAASALERSSVYVRIPVLTLPALGLVYMLAHAFEMTRFAAVSCIPTVVAVLILERWTRVLADPPPVPVARTVS